MLPNQDEQNEGAEEVSGPKIGVSKIHSEFFGSDHCPISLELKFPSILKQEVEQQE